MTRSKTLVALALGALTLASASVYAGEADFTGSNTPFQSTRTRAEVQAEAARAAYDPANGELGVYNVPAFQSTRTRAEVKAEAVVAAHQNVNGELGLLPEAPFHSTLSRADVKLATVQANKAGLLRFGEANF